MHEGTADGVVRRGDGLPIIALHGNGVDHRILLPLDASLERAGQVERIYLDLPGFGGSPALPDPGDLQHMADWLMARIETLVGDRPFALVGSSLGGLLARHVVAQLGGQVVGLALIAPVVDPDPRHRTLPALEAVERDAALLDGLTPSEREEFTSMTARQTRETWALFRDHVLPGVGCADPDAMHRLASRYRLDADPDERMGCFTPPALVLVGRQDHVVGFEDQFALADSHFPRATFVALYGAGHNVHLDCPEISSALVEQWARDVVREVSGR